MDWILARLSEPSTYAGFAGIALGFGISAPLYGAVAGVVAAVAGLAAVLLREGRI